MGSNVSENDAVIDDKELNEIKRFYVPLESLTEPVIKSVISVALRNSLNSNFSERTLLIFLLSIHEKLEEIKASANVDEPKINEKTIQQHADNIQKWLVNRRNEPLDWDKLYKKYRNITREQRRRQPMNKDGTHRYHELTSLTLFGGVKRSRVYISEFRPNGFQPEELKVYWCVEQLENLCPKPDASSEVVPPSHDPSDTDAVENLRKFPVCNRNHPVKISYVNKGIEEAVFDIPEAAQIIVLNFANEQYPGGGYLRNAKAQEEVICYNSDGYRALLDLKYQRMDGGYAIPEFGLAYVCNMRFIDPKSEKPSRLADMLVSACYCLYSSELYENPKTHEQLKKNNLAKFRAFMAAAIANTKQDGSNTYLLLGPIGTGAFGNEVKDICECFHEVLDMPLMNSNGPCRNAFGNIWFVSTDKWKNNELEKILSHI